MSISTMLGSGLQMGIDLWKTNNEYQLEKQRQEYKQAQERNKEQQAAADAARSLAEVARQTKVTNIIKWGAILVISLVTGNLVFSFLRKQLKGA